MHYVPPPSDVMAIFQVHFRTLRVRYIRARVFMAKFLNAPSILKVLYTFIKNGITATESLAEKKSAVNQQ